MLKNGGKIGKTKGVLKSIPKKLFATKKRGVITILVLVVLIAVCFFATKAFSGDPEATAYQNVTVDKGDISTVITGTGTISPKEQYQVVPLVQGEILSAPFEEGDQIQKGDLLYKIDSSDTSNNIARAKLSLEKAKLSANQNTDSVKDLTIKATTGGILQNFTLKVGDTVKSGDTIGTIVNRNNMILTVPYTSFSAKSLYVGESAKVFLEDYYQTITGTISRIPSGTRVTTDGAIVKDIEITVKNPGALTSSNTATATVGDLESYASGTFSYKNDVSIIAEVGGDVTKVNYKAGDKVSDNAVLVKLTSDAVDTQIQNDDLSIKDAQLSLAGSYDALDNYNITSPISGTVLQKSYKAGDTIGNSSSSTSSSSTASSSTTLAIVADMTQLKFQISVDELDISKIKVGQDVDVTADALTGKTFTGTVSKISMVGTTASGVTTYPVTIVMKPVSGLMPGMNVKASIVVEESKNTVRIPIAALVNGNMVLVADSSTLTGVKSNTSGSAAPKMTAPAGYKYIQVEIGISDKNYVEILSGLNKGDTVAMLAVADAAASGQAMVVTSDSGGAPPSGGGGAPGGGM